ncbi:MAG: chorismate mutase, partial [Victivallaceae bacterium]
MTEDSGLRKYRKEIDRIDDEILKLLNQRCELVRSIGALKEENGTPVFVPEREREIFNRLDSGNSGPLTPEAMRAIYREIMAAARELKRPMIV